LSTRGKTRGAAIGIDIGGVIIRPAIASGDTSFFSSGYLETPMVDGAFDAVAQLNREAFRDGVFLVSKARSGTARKTVEWLAHHRFHEITGVPLERVHFCERREDKAIIAKRLNLGAFIDDRVDVLQHLQAVRVRILFAATAAFVPAQAPPAGVRLAVAWDEALALLGEADAGS
jgi:hypothetical protein